MISAIRKVMRFHASQPRPPNFSTCSLHSFRASPAAIFLPRVAGWHGFDDWLHRWMVYIWKLRCESFVEEEDDWFPGENSFQTPITSSLSLSPFSFLSLLSLFLSLWRPLGQNSLLSGFCRLLFPRISGCADSRTIIATPVPCLPTTVQPNNDSETKILPLIAPPRFSAKFICYQLESVYRIEEC